MTLILSAASLLIIFYAFCRLSMAIGWMPFDPQGHRAILIGCILVFLLVLAFHGCDQGRQRRETIAYDLYAKELQRLLNNARYELDQYTAAVFTDEDAQRDGQKHIAAMESILACTLPDAPPPNGRTTTRLSPYGEPSTNISHFDTWRLAQSKRLDTRELIADFSNSAAQFNHAVNVYEQSDSPEAWFDTIRRAIDHCAAFPSINTWTSRIPTTDTIAVWDVSGSTSRSLRPLVPHVKRAMPMTTNSWFVLIVSRSESFSGYYVPEGRGTLPDKMKTQAYTESARVLIGNVQPFAVQGQVVLYGEQLPERISLSSGIDDRKYVSRVGDGQIKSLIDKLYNDSQE